MKALVTDGNQRSALAVTRSLGRRGITVLVGEEEPEFLAGSSRHCRRRVLYPSPYRDREGFRGFLADFVAREGVDLVVPVTDVTTAAVALDQERLGDHTALAVPPFEAFEAVTDKVSALEAAARLGIPIPKTHVVDGVAGLAGIAGRIAYPAVVKPARSRILCGRGWAATRVHYAASEADLHRLYEQTDYLTSHRSLIQERIVGPGVGLFVLFDRGRLLTAFAHRRLREKPPSGGVSVLCESIRVPAEMRDDASRLLGGLGWHGVAMLEYKTDAAGDRYLIEVNGRFWGSLQLAVDAGVDFPYLSGQLALGRRPDLPASYRVGVRSRWLLGDLDHLLSRLLHAPGELALPPGAPSRARALIDFASSTRPGVGDQVASGDDPGPFLHELSQYARSVWASAGSGARRRLARVRGQGLRLARTSIPN
jgi:predicted ATP-grasp superfamily ATP-dependent carboligase